MKFTIAILILGLVLGAQSSIVPFAAHVPLTYTSVSHRLYDPYTGAITYAHTPEIRLATPTIFTPPFFPTEGSYLAKTRGSVHVAPLPGHSSSAASINLEPAPGTF